MSISLSGTVAIAVSYLHRFTPTPHEFAHDEVYLGSQVTRRYALGNGSERFLRVVAHASLPQQCACSISALLLILSLVLSIFVHIKPPYSSDFTRN